MNDNLFTTRMINLRDSKREQLIFLKTNVSGDNTYRSGLDLFDSVQTQKKPFLMQTTTMMSENQYAQSEAIRKVYQNNLDLSSTTATPMNKQKQVISQTNLKDSQCQTYLTYDHRQHHKDMLEEKINELQNEKHQNISRNSNSFQANLVYERQLSNQQNEQNEISVIESAHSNLGLMDKRQNVFQKANSFSNKSILENEQEQTQVPDIENIQPRRQKGINRQANIIDSDPDQVYEEVYEGDAHQNQYSHFGLRMDRDRSRHTVNGKAMFDPEKTVKSGRNSKISKSESFKTTSTRIKGGRKLSNKMSMKSTTRVESKNFGNQVKAQLFPDEMTQKDGDEDYPEEEEQTIEDYYSDSFEAENKQMKRSRSDLDRNSQQDLNSLDSSEMNTFNKIKESKIIQTIAFLGHLILECLFFLLLSIVLPIMGIIVLFPFITAGEWQYLASTLFILVSSVCQLYTLAAIFFFTGNNPSIIFFQCDCIFFLLTSYVVYSYICIVIESYIKNEYDVDSLSWSFKTAKRFNILLLQEFKKALYKFDFYLFYQNQLIISNESENNDESAIQTEKQDRKPSTNKKVERIIKTYNDRRIMDLQKDLNDLKITPSAMQFTLIILTILFKVSLVMYFIYIQPENLSERDVMNIVILVFAYYLTAINLNTILGSYDLIRKKKFMKKMLDSISKKNSKFIELITSPQKLEDWDDERKLALDYQQNLLMKLEVTYFCFIFYYIFVILICASAFFKLNWIFPQESFLLEPINVILNTVNFIYISLLFLFRIYQGTKFNESFSEIKYQIAVLRDVVSDLITVPQFYDNELIMKQSKRLGKDKNNHFENVKKFKELPIYNDILSQIRQESQNLLREELSQISTKEDEAAYQSDLSQLMKSILLNLDRCYTKIAQSIVLDEERYSYQFANMFTINFKEFALTIILALLTSLPSIIPKFQQYLAK